MTNKDKSLLRYMVRKGRSDKEILKEVDCTLATIKKYRKALAE